MDESAQWIQMQILFCVKVVSVVLVSVVLFYGNTISGTSV